MDSSDEDSMESGYDSMPGLAPRPHWLLYDSSDDDSVDSWLDRRPTIHLENAPDLDWPEPTPLPEGTADDGYDTDSSGSAVPDLGWPEPTPLPEGTADDGYDTDSSESTVPLPGCKDDDSILTDDTSNMPPDNVIMTQAAAAVGILLIPLCLT